MPLHSRAEVTGPPCNPCGMSIRRLAFVLACVPIVTVVPVVAQGNDEIAKVRAAYAAQCSALVHGDFDAFGRTFSPEFMMHEEGQTFALDVVVTNLRNAFAQVHLTRCTTTIDSATQASGVTIAIVRQLIDGSQVTPQGVEPFELASGKRDMWVPSGGSVLEMSSSSLWETERVNGEIVHESGDVPSPAPGGDS